jgi:hypothetical protein
MAVVDNKGFSNINYKAIDCMCCFIFNIYPVLGLALAYLPGIL